MRRVELLGATEISAYVLASTTSRTVYDNIHVAHDRRSSTMYSTSPDHKTWKTVSRARFKKQRDLYCPSTARGNFECEGTHTVQSATKIYTGH